MKDDEYTHLLDELIAAEVSLQEMGIATSVAECLQHWKYFLNHLEKFWKKFSESSLKFNVDKHCFDTINALRKKDPLLSYLRASRNSDEHLPKAISETEQGSTKIFSSHGPATIHSGVIEGAETITNLSVDGELKFEIQPDKLKLISVSVWAGRFDPPNEHLGNSLGKLDPISVGTLGLKFYKDFFSTVKICD